MSDTSYLQNYHAFFLRTLRIAFIASESLIQNPPPFSTRQDIEARLEEYRARDYAYVATYRWAHSVLNPEDHVSWNPIAEAFTRVHNILCDAIFDLTARLEAIDASNTQTSSAEGLSHLFTGMSSAFSIRESVPPRFLKYLN